jgi:hypothetical protein
MAAERRSTDQACRSLDAARRLERTILDEQAAADRACHYGDPILIRGPQPTYEIERAGKGTWSSLRLRGRRADPNATAQRSGLHVVRPAIRSVSEPRDPTVLGDGLAQRDEALRRSLALVPAARGSLAAHQPSAVPPATKNGACRSSTPQLH